MSYEYDPRDWAMPAGDDGFISLNPTREGQTYVLVPLHPDSYLARFVAVTPAVDPDRSALPTPG